MEFLQQIPANFTVGVLVGLTLGIAMKGAARLLAGVAVLFIALELIRMAYLP